MSPQGASTARPPIPQEIRALIAAGGVVAIGFGIIAPVLPQFAQSFDVSALQITLIVSMFALFRLVFAPASGVLVDKFGERTTYISGLLIVAASTGACAFAASYWQLLTFRALGGIGSTMFTVSAMALIARMAPPQIRGRVNSLYGGAFIVGTMIGPVIGGVLGRYGLRVPFIVYAIGLIIAATVAASLLSGASLRASAKLAKSPMRVGEAFTLKSYQAIVYTAFGTGWVNFGVRIALLPLFLLEVYDQGPFVAGLVMTFFAIGNTIAVLWAGSLSDAVGRRPLLMVGVLLNGLATVAFAFSPNEWWVMIFSTLAGVGNGMFYPTMQAAIADIVGPDRGGGKVISAQQMAQDAGAIIGPLVAGAMVDASGYDLMFIIFGSFMMTAFFAWWRSPETSPKHESRSRVT